MPANEKAGSPVYCAGPIFSTGDRDEQEATAAALTDDGYVAYLPHRDGIDLGYMLKRFDTVLHGSAIPPVTLPLRKLVFALDVYQVLDRCQSVVVNLDGRTPDEGAVVEATAAYVAGKPIVVHKSSPITMAGGVDNPMVQGLSSTWTYVDTVEGIPEALGAAVTRFEEDPGDPYAAPPSVASIIQQGEQVFTWLDSNRMPRGDLNELIEWTAGLVKETKLELSSDEEVREWTDKLIGLLGELR